VKEWWRQFLTGWIGQLFGGLSAKRKERKIELCETLSFGDRRFVALIAVEGQKFLVGGASNSISLLTSLPQPGAPAVDHSYGAGIKILK
jgi:flagellar biogenesis protein FliO